MHDLWQCMSQLLTTADIEGTEIPQCSGLPGLSRVLSFAWQHGRGWQRPT